MPNGNGNEYGDKHRSFCGRNVWMIAQYEYTSGAVWSLRLVYSYIRIASYRPWPRPSEVGLNVDNRFFKDIYPLYKYTKKIEDSV
jgi:hypothetical protein